MMKKIVVLGGAAHMARPAIKYLNKLDEVAEIILADLNVEEAKKFGDELGPKASVQKVDATNELTVSEVIKGTDLVMNFIGPYYRFGTVALSAAIQEGINYLDICDDYDVTIDALKLNDFAKDKNVTALTGMGASPGITNVLARLGADELDEVKEIHTYWVVGDAEPSGFGALVHMFHIIEGKIPTFKNGKIQHIQAFQRKTSQKVNFGDPVGEVTLYHVGHPEPITLSRYIDGVETVTNYGALLPEFQNPMFKTLVDLGLTSEEPIPFRNEKVAPLEFLLDLFKLKQEKTFKKESGENSGDSVVAARIETIGKKSGEQAKYTFTKSSYDNMANGTSIPAGVAAELMLKGEVNVKGVIPPEGIDPKLIIHALEKVNYFAKGNTFEVTKEVGPDVVSGKITDNKIFPEFW